MLLPSALNAIPSGLIRYLRYACLRRAYHVKMPLSRLILDYCIIHLIYRLMLI